MAAILKPAVEIRAMTRGDLDAVSEIEQRSYPYPWTRGIFQDCLRVKYCCHVLEADAAIAGYGIVSQPVEEAHLLNLCVHPDYRRGGLAALLLEFLMREASLGGAAVPGGPTQQQGRRRPVPRLRLSHHWPSTGLLSRQRRPRRCRRDGDAHK